MSYLQNLNIIILQGKDNIAFCIQIQACSIHLLPLSISLIKVRQTFRTPASNCNLLKLQYCPQKRCWAGVFFTVL